MQCAAHVARTARKAWVVLLALGLFLVPASAATAASRQASGTDQLLIAAAGWHGRAIQQPHPHDSVRTSTTSPPSGWSAGTVALGAGLKSASGSRRVRDIQRRLLRLGYRTGPADGIYGPRTRAAVAWFQRKHGLPLSGRTTVATLRHLRERTGAARAHRPPANRTGETTAPSSSPETTIATTAPSSSPETTIATPPAIPASQASGGELSSWWKIAALGFILLHFLALLGYIVGRRWRRQAEAGIVQPVPRLSASVPVAPTKGTRALGYIRLARGAPSASFHAQAAAIETGCIARKLKLVSLVSDVEPDCQANRQPSALAYALEQLNSGEADRLVVSRLDHLAKTREELAALLELIAQSDGGLVVLDRDLDTASLADPVEPDKLLSHHPAPRARLPKVADTHPIDTHIASMLDEGLSPRDIASALNDESVPPPEGIQWGFRGVEAALRRRGEDTEPMERSNA